MSKAAIGRTGFAEIAAEHLADAASRARDRNDLAGETHEPSSKPRQRLADPLEARRAEMAIVVEGDVGDAGLLQAVDRGDDLAARCSRSGMRRAEDAAQLAGAAKPPLHVPGIDAHASGARLVEAGLDDAGGLGERREVAALVPGAAGRPRHRRDDRDSSHPCGRRLDLATSEVTTSQRQARNCPRSPSVRVSASQNASAMSSGRSKSLARYASTSSRTRVAQALGIDAGRPGAGTQWSQKQRPS